MKKHESTWAVARYVILGLVVLAAGGAWALWGADIQAYFAHEALTKAFEGREKEFYDQAEGIFKEHAGSGKVPPDAHRAGKAVWIRARLMPHSNRFEMDLDIDPSAGQLAEELRAERPEDVRSVVLLYPKSGQVGEYVPKDGSSTMVAQAAYEERVDVRIVDLQKKALLGHKVFTFSPKHEITHSSERFEVLDMGQVLAWYASLPEAP